MDGLQLKLCDMQGRLFARAGGRGLPSAAFIRLFLTSETARALDAAYHPAQWMGEAYLLEEVLADMGDAELEAGEVFPPDELYWMGAIYRYWQIRTGESSAQILRQASVKTMRAGFMRFHPMAPELVIDALRENHRRESQVVKARRARKKLAMSGADNAVHAEN